MPAVVGIPVRPSMSLSRGPTPECDRPAADRERPRHSQGVARVVRHFGPARFSNGLVVHATSRGLSRKRLVYNGENRRPPLRVQPMVQQDPSPNFDPKPPKKTQAEVDVLLRRAA